MEIYLHALPCQVPHLDTFFSKGKTKAVSGLYGQRVHNTKGSQLTTGHHEMMRRKRGGTGYEGGAGGTNVDQRPMLAILSADPLSSA